MDEDKRAFAISENVSLSSVDVKLKNWSNVRTFPCERR